MNRHARQNIHRAHDVRRHTQAHILRDSRADLTREQRIIVAVVQAQPKRGDRE